MRLLERAFMAVQAGGQPSFLVGQPATTLAPSSNPTNTNSDPLDFSNLLKLVALNNPMQLNPNMKPTVDSIPFKLASFLHGQPFVKFTKVDVDRMNIIESLQYTVV